MSITATRFNISVFSKVEKSEFDFTFVAFIEMLSNKITSKKAPRPNKPNKEKSYSELKSELKDALSTISEFKSAIEKIREPLNLGYSVVICDFCSLPRPEGAVDLGKCLKCEDNDDADLLYRCSLKCKDEKGICNICGGNLDFEECYG